MGRSDVFLKLEILKKMVGVLILLLSLHCGPLTFIAWKACGDFICTFINAWPNQRLLSYSIGKLWKDILPALLASAAMGISVYIAGNFLPAGIPGLAGQVVLGILLYLGISWGGKMESFSYLMGILQEKIKKS